jgi:uncharacterized 2Fe-2S/4Fe-4S cluster protein (DUF4445 family)
MHSVRSLAMAVDVGTTTLAASLLDLQSGERLAFAGRVNPQRRFGADVVARLQAACRAPADLELLKALINSALEELAEELLDSAAVSPDALTRVALAGNPAMEQFILGLPATSLAYPPFRPLFSAGRHERTGQLGWRRDLPVYLFPLPGGFVGGDLVAFLHHCSGADVPHASPRTPHVLYLDMGTNGELALVCGDSIWATSAAAGPAFEGGNLACGMAALPGAIDRITIAGDRLSFSTIADAPPTGMCGSGVIDAVCALLRAGVLDPTGRLLPADEIDSNLANRIMEADDSRSFVLYRDAVRTVHISQDDIRQVQLAKAAIRAGIEVLLQRAGITADDLDRVVLTGSFGAVLAPDQLKNVGIFTENMVNSAGFIREGALLGVERALLEPEGMHAVDALAGRIRVIPLSGTPLFERHFLQQMDFPPP